MTTLLYVDDEESIGRIVARYFSRRGDNVLLARSVAEARAILEHTDPAAVFIDVWLGAESGFELMSWIDDCRPHLADRVTFVTGEFVDASPTNRAWKTLGRPVLQKPFALTSLAASVDGAEIRAAT